MLSKVADYSLSLYPLNFFTEVGISRNKRKYIGVGTSLAVQWLRVDLAVDVGSIPGQETRIPFTVEHLSLHATTGELCAAVKDPA